jgi:ACS family glucarate transporter-like MFS transporter
MTPTASARSTHRPTRVRWRICALMTGVSFVAYLLRSNMSVAGVPMSAELGLSHVQLGMILAGFAWGYALFQFPGGLLGDLVGARRALTALLVLWGTLNLLVGFIPAASAAAITGIMVGLVVLRFLMGLAQAPLFPIIGGGTVGSWFPVSGWAMPNALQNFGATFGAAASGPLITWLLVTFGWRASFLLTAPSAFLCAAAWWWYVRDRPTEHPGVNREERDLIEAGRTAAELAPVERGAWRIVLRNRQILLLTAGYFCVNYLWYFFFNWLFLYLIESRGLKLLQGGWYAAVPWMAGAVGAVAGGWLCDRWWRRIGPRRACSLLGAAGVATSGVLLYAAGQAPHAIAAVALLSLCLAAEQFTDAIYWAAGIALAGRNASAACGLLNTGGNLSGGLAGLLVPILVDRLGWPAALASGSLFAFAAAGLWLITAVERPADAPAGPVPLQAAVQ